jgi:hypothetical protein
MQPTKRPATPQTMMSGSLPDEPPTSPGALAMIPPPLPVARRSPWPRICLGISLILFSAVVAGILKQSLSTFPSDADDDDAVVQVDTEIASVPATDESSPAEEKTKNAVRDRGRRSKKRANTPGATIKSESDPKPIPKSTVAPINPSTPTPNDTAEDIFDDLRRRQFQLELPDKGVLRSSTEELLARLPIPAGEVLQLALKGEGAADLQLVQRSDDLDHAPAWTVIKQASAAFGGVEEVQLGRFVHRDQELKFQWDPQAPPWAKPASLQMAQLVLSVGMRQQTCQLWRTVTVDPIRIQKSQLVDVPLPGQLTNHPEKMRIQFQLAGTGHADPPTTTAGLGDVATITLGETAENTVELQLKVITAGTANSLEVNLFGSPPVMGQDGVIRSTRQEITLAAVQNQSSTGRGQHVKKVESEVKKLKTSQSKLREQVAHKVAKKKNSNLAGKSRADADIKTLNHEIADMETKIEKLEAEIAGERSFVEKNSMWCDGVKEILRNLEGPARLRYAVYVPAEPPVRMIETTGFVWEQK